MIKFITFLFALVALQQLASAYTGNLTLQRVVSSIRHGQRSYDFNFKAFFDAYDKINGGTTGLDEIKVGLTLDEGFVEMFDLGDFLRERYLVNQDFIHDGEQAFEVRIENSDYPRISESAHALAQGLYPLGTGPTFNGSFALPEGATAPFIMENPRFYPYDNCARYSNFLQKQENSIRTSQEAFTQDEFLAIVEANPTLSDWFHNVWNPRINDLYAEGVRLNSTGGVGLLTRALQFDLKYGLMNVPSDIVGILELLDANKFGGLAFAAGAVFIPVLDVSTSASYAAQPYIDLLVEDLLEGRGWTPGASYSTIDEDVKMILYVGHSQTRDYTLFPMNPSQWDDASQGDFAIWEYYTDSEDNGFVRTYRGTVDLQLFEVTPPTCSNFTCPVDEWLENLQQDYLDKDTITECSELSRCESDVSTTSWPGGANVLVELTPGWDEFGWTTQLTFNDSFTLNSVWGAQLVSHEGNVVTLKNPDYHNHIATEGVALSEIGLNINYSGDVPAVVETRFSSSLEGALLVCDDVSAKKKRELQDNYVDYNKYTLQDMLHLLSNVDMM